MIRQYQPLLYIILLIGLCACATVPDLKTNEERLAAIEIGYQQVLQTATRWKAEGRLSTETINQFTAAFDGYEAARNAALVAIDLADAAEAQTAVNRTSQALTALRDLIARNQ